MKLNKAGKLLIALACLVVAASALAFALGSPAAFLAQQSDNIVAEESTFFATAFVDEQSTYNPFSDGDLWPAAWSDDDYLYTTNGDGKGFDPYAPMSDIVVNQVTGHPDTRNVTGIRLTSGDQVGQVWSDPAKYNRKPTGMVSVDGVLYLAVQDLRSETGAVTFNDAPAATILKSTDKGRTWTWDTSQPMFDEYQFTTIMFLDYGKDSQNNTFDQYVYAYGLDYNWRDSFSGTVTDPTNLYLARVPKDKVQDRRSWEFYAGDRNGQAKWTGQITSKQPVLQEGRRIYSETLSAEALNNMTVLSQGSIVYNQPLNRYIYTSWTEYTFEFYEAPTPWGPWKRFLSRDFGVYPWFPSTHGGYATVIPSKYISVDGTEMWMNSNTFMGGIKNYNLSLRRLLVTPYAPTTPSNQPSDANLALPANAQNVTPISRANFHYDNVEFLNDGVKDHSEDSWNGERKNEDYWGYTWSQAYNLNTVVYTTGKIFGADGGWFDNLRVQVRQNHQWIDVKNLSSMPSYPGSSSAGEHTAYTFTFDDTWGDGVRIIGAPGGIAKFTSFAELEIYYSR